MEHHRVGLDPLRTSTPRAGMIMLLLFLLFEYLRLHAILPILGALQVQTVVTAALLLIVIAQTARGGVHLSRQSWLFLGFLGLAVFTIIAATNQFRAYQFAYGLSLTLIGFFAITHIVQNERDLRRFLSLLVSIHIYLATRVILGYNPAGFNPQGYATAFSAGSYFLGDENDVALAMTVILPLAIHLLRQNRSSLGRLFWGAGSVVILLSIIFTFSRGGFIGLTALLLYWVVTSKNRGKAFGILCMIVALVVIVAPSRYWERMETIQDTDSGTAMRRRDNWAAARRMFYDSPIWGVGGNNFGVLLPEYSIGYSEEQRPTQWGRASHSMYFDLMAMFGLVGMLLIGSVLVLNFRDLRLVSVVRLEGDRSGSIGHLADSLRLSLVGFLVPAAFLSVLGYPHLYYLTALIVVVRRLALAESTQVAIEPMGVLERTQ